MSFCRALLPKDEARAEETGFSLLEPQMRDIENANLEEMVQLSSKSIAERIIMHIRKGKEGEPMLNNLCKNLLNTMLLCKIDGSPLFEKMGAELKLISDALLSIIGREVNVDPDSVKEFEKQAGEHQTGLVGIVNSALVTSAHWQD